MYGCVYLAAYRTRSPFFTGVRWVKIVYQSPCHERCPSSKRWNVTRPVFAWMSNTNDTSILYYPDLPLQSDVHRWLVLHGSYRSCNRAASHPPEICHYFRGTLLVERPGPDRVASRFGTIALGKGSCRLFTSHLKFPATCFARVVQLRNGKGKKTNGGDERVRYTRWVGENYISSSKARCSLCVQDTEPQGGRRLYLRLSLG